MSGFDRLFPGRKVLNEVISDGVAQKTGFTGWTAQFAGGVRYNSWATPLAPSSSIGAGTVAIVLAGTTSGPTLVAYSTSAGAPSLGAMPDYPRNVRMYPSTSAFVANASSSAFFVTINGTNQFGATVSDTIFLGGGPGPVDGTVAFKTITSIVIPACSSAGTPFTFGVGNTFGLDRTPLSQASVVAGAVNGTRESTYPVLGAASSSGTGASAAVGAVSFAKGTAKFATAATSSAGALVEISYIAQDTTHI